MVSIMSLSWVQKVYAFVFGTRLELSEIHKINASQSTILAQIQADVRAGFSGQVARIDRVEVEIQSISSQIERLDREVDDLRVSLSRLEKSHFANHPG